ncbi:MAG: AarF/UbiB family protein [Actinomycetota bacterium]|nr:AarF/UbiB family protein [Actinomycetota bacterium]MDQ6946011.1 AarF/UbiB family protein [Actinomycetota bacterium]
MTGHSCPPDRSYPPDRASLLLSDEAVRTLTRAELARAIVMAAVATRHLVPGLVRRRGRTAAALAPRINAAVMTLGPPAMKLSQVVASSPGLFPAPVSDALRHLLDAAPPVPWPGIRDTIEMCLRAPVTELFATIDPVPLAAASIAQVHAATLHDGRRVVVKVRRPGVEHQFQTDLRLMRLGARVADRLSWAARVFNPVAIVDNTVAALRQELDFRLEADAMERFEANLRAYGDNDCVYVPAVYRQLSGAEVLTMERIDGTKVDDLVGLQRTGFDLRQLLRAGVRAWVESACEHGFFHGDAHAGNLMVDEKGRAVFLDFGIMGQLDETTRWLLRRGVVALLHRRDFEEVTACLAELGAHLGGRVEQARAAVAIRRLAEPLMDKPLSELDYQEVLSSAMRQAAPHGVQLPPSLVLLFKQVIYFERYAKLVAPDWDILLDTYLIEFML